MRAPCGDHHALDDVALDVEAEDRLRGLVRLVGGLGDLDAAGLAAAAGLDLRLDDDDAADLLGCGPRLLRRVRDDAGEHRHLVLLEKVSCLVLVQIHSAVLRWGEWWGVDAEKRLDVEIIDQSPSLLPVDSGVPTGAGGRGRARRPLDPRAVRGEPRRVQRAVPRALGVVPRQDAAEVRAHRADRARRAVDGRDADRVPGAAGDDAPALPRAAATGTGVELRRRASRMPPPTRRADSRRRRARGRRAPSTGCAIVVIHSGRSRRGHLA